MTRDIRVTLTSIQESTVGKVLGHLYYRAVDLLELAPGQNGCPHNGGEHTFFIMGPPGDCVAWMELVSEQFPSVRDIFGVIVDDIKQAPPTKRMFNIGNYADRRN